MTSRPPLTPRWRRALRCAPALAGLLAGCAVPPAQHAPTTNMPPTASLPATGAAALHPHGDSAAWLPVTPEAVPLQWWSLFNDATLSALQARAASGNLDLQLAAERVAQSRAELGLSESAQQPQLGLGAGYSREALSANSPLAALGAPTQAYDTWRLGVQASWELDLWGYLRQRSQAAQARWQVSAYEQQAAHVALTAEVARQYLTLRGVQTQVKLLARQTELANELLAQAQAQVRNGSALPSDVASARAELARLQAQATALGHRREVLANALALLLGLGPRELEASLAAEQAIPALPVQLPVGMPSELARRRPDILRAEAQLRAATAELGAAEADFYPRISLTGSLGMQAFKLQDLGSWDSRQYSLGPTFYLPLFDGARLQRTLALTQAHQRSAGLAYRQTVLRAWHEVDDALSACATEAQRHQQLQQASAQDELALDLAQRAWRQGAVEPRVVLQARRAVLASQAALADSATAGSLAVVALYRALGGGWADSQAHRGPTGGSTVAPVAVPSAQVVTAASASSGELP